MLTFSLKGLRLNHHQPTPHEIVLARQESLDKRSFILAPSASVLERPNNQIQFGYDAFSAGVIEAHPDHYAEVFSVLRSCANEQTRLATKLSNAGLDDIAAQSLIADLTTYGILREVGPKPVVAVLGTTHAADLVRDTLTRSDITVRSPLSKENEFNFINHLGQHIPIIVVDFLHRIEALSPLLCRRPNVIPAALCDVTALVGPIRIGGKGPCINCLGEHERGKDQHWLEVAADYKPKRYDPVAEVALAAKVTAVATAMVGIQPGAGAAPHPISAGAVTRTDPFALTTTHDTMTTHRLCRYCHQFQQEAEAWKELEVKIAAQGS